MFKFNPQLRVGHIHHGIDYEHVEDSKGLKLVRLVKYVNIVKTSEAP